MTSELITGRSKFELRKRLLETPIRLGQLDFNGKCNAKCWYCPVRYEGNPADFATHMPIKDLTHLLANLRASPLIAPDFSFVYTSHYNEVLLYRHFDEMIDVFRTHGFATMVLSNGTPLTPQKTDTILANTDVIRGICLNIPAIEKTDWCRKTGLSAAAHKRLMENLDYIHGKIELTIQINYDPNSGGYLDKSIGTTEDEGNAIAEAFRERYPKFNISPYPHLSDRAGRLDQLGVITRQAETEPKRVIGCRHSGSRIFQWFHVNARGDLFLCCDDFDMHYRFGNLLTESFEDAWTSDRHVDAILEAFSGICKRCWGRIEDE